MKQTTLVCMFLFVALLNNLAHGVLFVPNTSFTLTSSTNFSVISELSNVTSANLSTFISSKNNVSSTLGLIHNFAACALADGTNITVTVNGSSIVLEGRVGLAPNWTKEALSSSEEQLVSACLFALEHSNNATQCNETIVMLGVDAHGQPLPSTQEQLLGWPVREGAFFGNLFETGTPAFVCNDGITSTFADLTQRFCALPPPGSGFSSVRDPIVATGVIVTGLTSAVQVTTTSGSTGVNTGIHVTGVTSGVQVTSTSGSTGVNTGIHVTGVTSGVQVTSTSGSTGAQVTSTTTGTSGTRPATTTTGTATTTTTTGTITGGGASQSRCPPLKFVGSCSSVCTASSNGLYYTSCSFGGHTYLPITTRLMPSCV